MKVLFLHPPSPFLLDERAIAPLGVLQIAACMEQRGWEVDVLDLAGNLNYVQSTVEQLSKTNYDAVGITTTTQQTYKIPQLLDAIRKHGKYHIVAGGAGPTTDPTSYVKLGFDKVVRNEGEYAWNAWEKDGPQIITSPLIHNLDELPFPSRGLVDLKNYTFYLKDRAGKIYKPTTHVVSTRGCPFGCNFCSGRELEYYRKYREFSPKRIVAEMIDIANKFKITAFTDYADEVNIRKERLLEFCKIVKEYDFKLRGFIVCRLFDEETAKAISDAGFIEVCAGVESADNEILLRNNIRKTTAETSLHACKLAQDYGIRFKSFTMLGLPGETEKSAYKLRDWLLNAKPDDYDISVFLPMPGGPIYEHPERFTDFTFDKLDFTKELAFYKGVPGEYKSYVTPEGMNRERLVQLRDEIDYEVREKLGYTQLKRKDKQEQAYDHSMGQR